jgi:hypothetical protein
MLKDIWVVNPGRQMLVKVGRPFTPQVGVSDGADVGSLVCAGRIALTHHYYPEGGFHFRPRSALRAWIGRWCERRVVAGSFCRLSNARGSGDRGSWTDGSVLRYRRAHFDPRSALRARCVKRI